MLTVLIVCLVTVQRSSDAAVSVGGFPVATGAEHASVAVSSNTAVWSVSQGGGDIRGKNLSTGTDLDLPSLPGAQMRPAVSGRIVVWEDTSSGDSDIYGLDLSAPQEPPFPVAVGPGEQARPAVGGGVVVWEDRDAVDSDVVAKDLASGTVKTIASGPQRQDSPAVGGDQVVWREETLTGDSDIHGYDLAEDQEYEVAVGPGYEYDPAVAGRLVTWVDDPGRDADVRAKDISTGEEIPVATGPAQQEAPTVSGDTVIWETQRNKNDGSITFDLQGARLDLAPVAPAGLTATGSVSGVALRWRGNAETDLDGYNVYRSASEGGEYTKLNTRGPISASSFNDAQAPKGARSYYRVTAVDAAGSESGAARGSAVVPKATSVTLSANSTLLDSLVPGSSVALSGRLVDSDETPIAGKKVVIKSKPLGSSVFAPIAGGEVTTDTTGAFSLAGLHPDRNTEYQASFDTDAEELQSATSPTVAVDVKQLVNTSFSTRQVKLGKSVRVTGTVFPASTGNVTLDIARNGVPLTKVNNVPLQSSRFSLSYKPPVKGVYTVKVTLDGYPQYLVTPSTGTFRVKSR